MNVIEENIKILIVDDDSQSRGLILEVLRPLSHEMLTANNGDEGLVVFNESQPLLVITDLQMPIMNGLELIKSIRTLGSRVPIVAISGAPEILSEASLAGANVILEKPFSMDEMLSAVKKHLQERLS